MYVDAIINTKGGAGKTTYVGTSAAYLAEVCGKRVLMLDGDKQPTLSSMFKITERAPFGISSLVRKGTEDLSIAQDCVSQTVVPGLDVIVSDAGMGELEHWIMARLDGRMLLSMALSQFADQYDHIVIDTAGTVGPLQEAAIFAADRVISPLPPTILPTREFVRGTIGMMNRVGTVIEMMQRPLPQMAVIPYMADHTSDAKIVLTALRDPTFGSAYRGDITVLDHVIPTTVVYREAARTHTPLHKMLRSRAGKAQDGFFAVMDELYPEVERVSPGASDKSDKEA